MKQHVPFHVHVSSMDSGSTVETMVDRVLDLQKDLPVKYATITDHGFMGDCFKFYDVCKKKKVKPILGVEGYFKDDTCAFIQGDEVKLKYNHIILHFMDQEAYQKGCELLSKADSRGIVAGGERKPLFNWADLEEFSKYNVTLGTACLLGMATRYLLIGRPDLAVKYYMKLRDMFKDNFYVELLPHVCDKKWENGVRLHFNDNTSLFVRTDSKLDTDYKDEVTAQEVYNYSSKVNFVKARYYRKQRIEINKELVSVERVKDFVLQEDGDVQLNANKFCLAMAMKYGDKIVISEDAHYATTEDKVVQDMRLGEDFRFYGSYHLMDKTEVYDYFMNVMSVPEEMIDGWVDNSYEWAKKFDNFELKYEYCLPVPERDSLIIIGEWIKEMGRMKNDPVYIERLRREIDTLKNNGKVDLLPYFIPIKEAIKHYADNGEFCSIGRGSAGGCLLAYLIGITHVDPIKYKLSFERFYSIDRAQAGDIPDIDCDFGSRELLVGADKQSGFLYSQYGDCVAQISTRMLMRLKSSIKDVNRFINKGSVEPEIDKIAEGLPVPPQGVSDQDFVYGYTDSDGNEIEGILETSEVLKRYVNDRPNEWRIVERALGLARNNSSHACFAGGTLVDNNGKVGVIESAVFSKEKPIKTWSSGIKNTVLVSMSNGISIRCTPDHLFICKNNEEVEAKDLIGKEIQYSAFSNCSGNKVLDEDELFALGWGLNDGSFNKKHESQAFYFTPKKDDEAKEKILLYLKREGLAYWDDYKRKDMVHVRIIHGRKHDLFFESGRNFKQRLPYYFWDLTFEGQCHFLHGFFSANGFVLNTKNRVGFKISSRLLASDICTWFHSIGIQTGAQYVDPGTVSVYGRAFNTNGNVEITLSGSKSKDIFKKNINFYQTYKKERLESIPLFSNREHFKETKKPICRKILPQEDCEVFDFNEPIESMGFINGVLVHNSAFAIANKPIYSILPTFSVGSAKNITQYAASSVESAKIIKYDFLCVAAYNDMNMCIRLINKKDNYKPRTAGWFLHEGKEAYLGDLPYSEGAYQDIGNGLTETLFQVGTKAMTPFCLSIKPNCPEDLSIILALCRPGPMDYTLDNGRTIAEEYIARRNGISQSDNEALLRALPDTYALPIFQENITSIVKEIGGMDPITAEKLRKLMSKKKKTEFDKMKPIFIDGAISKGVSKESSEQIWSMMETFSRYAFCAGHSQAYGIITYITAFLKHHYPLEWWAAVLSNADDKEVNQTFYKHIKDMLTPPDINLSDESITIDYANKKLRSKLSLVAGLGEKAAEKIKTGRPYHSIIDMVEKQTVPEGLARKLIYLGVMDCLFQPNVSTLSKLQAYEDALIRHQRIKKVKENIEKNDLKIAENLTNPKELIKLNKKHDKLLNDFELAKSLIGTIPEELIGMSPIREYLFKKQLLPSLPLQLHPLMKKYCDNVICSNGKFYVEDDRNHTVALLPGEVFQTLQGRIDEQDLGYATTAYILEAKEFVYGGTKRALKMQCDIDGFSTELVLWPNYDSGELVYPDNLKNSATILFFYKKQGKEHGRITEIKIIDTLSKK